MRTLAEMAPVVYLGPPGTGKTTTLLRIVEEELERGTPPERIAYVSFTQRAAAEAVERACAKFDLTPADFPYFRTLHSLSTRMMGYSKADFLTGRHLGEFAAAMGVVISDGQVEDGLPMGNGSGDRMMFIDGYARTTGDTLHNVWRQLGDGLDWRQQEQFSAAYTLYRQDVALLDFTDVLEQYARGGEQLPVDVVIVDEGQDLSTLQWRVVLRAMQGASRVVIAGDDDQAIYKWSGANVDAFLALPGRKVVLGTSHRLPRAVHAFANTISARIRNRYAKDWQPRDSEGSVRHHHRLDGIELDPSQSWLLLARNNYLLAEYVEHVRALGLPFTRSGFPAIAPTHVDAIYAWEKLRKGDAVPLERVRQVYNMLRSGDGVKRGHKSMPNATDDQLYTLELLRAEHGLLAEGNWFDVLTGIPAERRWYYRNVLRRHGSLRTPAQVHINTIHTVKGGEADNVVLLGDMSRRTWQGMQAAPDDEHRVFYVGATRARHALHVVGAKGNGYPFP